MCICPHRIAACIFGSKLIPLHHLNASYLLLILTIIMIIENLPRYNVNILCNVNVGKEAKSKLDVYSEEESHLQFK